MVSWKVSFDPWIYFITTFYNLALHAWVPIDVFFKEKLSVAKKKTYILCVLDELLQLQGIP